MGKELMESSLILFSLEGKISSLIFFSVPLELISSFKSVVNFAGWCYPVEIAWTCCIVTMIIKLFEMILRHLKFVCEHKD